MSKLALPPKRGLRVLRAVGVSVACLLIIAGYGLVLLVGEAEVGGAGGWLVLLVLAVSSVALGLGIVRLAARVKVTLRAGRTLFASAAALSACMIVALLRWAPEITANALASVSSLHPGTPAWLADVAGRMSRAIVPAAANPSTEARNAASPSDRPKGEPRGARRFSAGNIAYTEPDDACEALSDTAEPAGAYIAERPRASLEALAKTRYSTGLPYLAAQDDSAIASWLIGAPSTFAGAASRFDVVVHEGSHIWNAKHSDFGSVSYSVSRELTVKTRRLKNFHRSEILKKLTGAEGDTYATTYLTGRSGAQGFNTLLDEYNAYTHSLASRYCTRDLLDPHMRVSARDGILAMMLYVEIYLRLAREEHPTDYQAILEDAGHRQMIVTVWDRAELWLRRSEPFANLGISDTHYEALAYSGEALAEIARVRDLEKR